jgi:hypothetical protein
MNKETRKSIDHAATLIPHLLNKAQLLEGTANDLDDAKEGRSKYAPRLRQYAAILRQEADDLKAAIDAAVSEV